MLMAQKVLTDEKLCEDVGRRLNLDMDRLRQDAYSPAIQGEVLQQRKLAIDLKVDGTPAFIVMDSSGTGEPIAIAGAIPLKQFAAAIAQVRGQAKTI
jgi:protein-disulfide isomerase